MLPPGFLGTRANLLMDVAILLFTALPFVILTAITQARHARLTFHRNLQVGTLITVTVALLLFETDIRLQGGTRVFLANSTLPPSLVGGFLLLHVAIAAATFGSWLVLVLSSWRRFRQQLPGSFSDRHARWGRRTLTGICLTSGTGCGVYLLVFVV
jgi:uncharacterized membrane protein YozB (DUF420 family)